jgi:hypothetical protein
MRVVKMALTIGITTFALAAGAAPQAPPIDSSAKKCEQTTSSQKGQPSMTTPRETALSRSTSSGARTGGKGSAPGSGFHANRVARGPASGPHDAPSKSRPDAGGAC